MDALHAGHRKNREWLRSSARQFRADGAWSDKTIAQWAWKLAELDPNRIVITDKGEDYSVRYLVGAAEALVSAFRERGLSPGDVISYQLPNWYESAIINLAAAMAGLVMHHIVPIYREREVGFALGDCKSKVIFLPACFRGFDYREMIRRVLPELPRTLEVVVVRGDAQEFKDFQALCALPRAQSFPDVRTCSPKFIMYTSGTTSRPKGVVHSHNGAYADAQYPVRHMRVDSDSRYLVAPSVAHIAGTVFGHELPFMLGCRAIFLDAWSADAAVELLRRYHCTHFHGPTPFLVAARESAKGQPFPDLITVGSGGAGVPPSVIEKMAELCPNALVYRAYGCTEVPNVTASPVRTTPHKGAVTDGALGRTELKLVDSSGASSPTLTEGEILVRGAQMMLGYLHPEDNEDAYDAHGYFRTGDIGRIEDGHLIIVDRKKDIIIRHGENVSAKEVEDLLSSHSAVADVAVVAMPDAKTGERVCAFVVPKAGQVIQLDGLQQYLFDLGLSQRKWPEYLVVVDALPRSLQGKVLKQELRQRARKIAENSQRI